MRTMKFVACYTVLFVLTLVAPASAQVLEFATVDAPGATATLPRGINARGEIVGFYGTGGVFRAFLLQDGIFTDIDRPGASATRPGRW